jgi:hypothetical protein
MGAGVQRANECEEAPLRVYPHAPDERCAGKSSVSDVFASEKLSILPLALCTKRKDDDVKSYD